MSPPHSTLPAPREFYDGEYHFQEDSEKPDNRRMARLLERLAPLEGMTFLDLGCGAGWAASLAKTTGRVARTIGLDFSSTALQLARRRDPAILWIQADGGRLPLATDAVDRIFCGGSIEHFPDVAGGIVEVYRVLKPAGRAVLVVPNFYVRTEQPLEFRATYWGWKKLIEQAGLTIDRVGTDWGPPVFRDATFRRVIVRSAGKLLSLLPRLQYQFVFTCSKPPRSAA